MDDQEDWRLDAKCKGTDPSDWDVIDESVSSRAKLEAKAKCSGCPVFLDCAADALYHFDFGVVRAGIPLSPVVGVELMKQYNELRRIVGEPEQPVQRGKHFVGGAEGRSRRFATAGGDDRVDDAGEEEAT